MTSQWHTASAMDQLSNSIKLIPPSASMFLPGTGQLMQRRPVPGLIWLSTALLLGGGVVLGQAGIHRLWNAAAALGLPPEASVWGLAGMAVAIAFVHVAAVVSCRLWAGPLSGEGLHPIVPGGASALVPGWGQILNGDLARAVVFLTATWITVTAWLLASPAVQDFLAAHQLVLPGALTTLTSEPLRWAMLAALWPLAVYDAGASAAFSRR